MTAVTSPPTPVCTPWEGPLPYPVHYPFEEPTAEQRRVIEQWRSDVGKLGIDRDRLVFSPDEMRRVKRMGSWGGRGTRSCLRRWYGTSACVS